MDAGFVHRLTACAAGASLPRHDFFFTLADKAASVLERERKPWRPCGKNGAPGGLIDFSAETQAQLPLIVVPDLHARTYFLSNLLQFVPPADFFASEYGCRTVLEALEAKAVRVVCVGDILHSELRGRGRWHEAWSEFLNGTETGPAMEGEMKEGLSLLAMVMELKCAFPEHFHILKGNHENILNEKGGGNFPFCKFANEGEMVRLFIQKKYGDDVLLVISCFEKALPLAAAFRECVVSHAEPSRFFSRQEIIDGMQDEAIVRGLTWTENDAAEPGSVQKMLRELTGRDDWQNARYFAGHRPVKGNYALRQETLLAQLHNPERQNVALISPGKLFRLDEDIRSVAADGDSPSARRIL